MKLINGLNFPRGFNRVLEKKNRSNGDARSVRGEASKRQPSPRSHHQTRPRFRPLPPLPLSLEPLQRELGMENRSSSTRCYCRGIPYAQKHLKGPKWLPFVIGLPPLLMFSAASSAFGGYALPKFTQLIVTSYYTASSVSHYGVSLLTRHIEEDRLSSIQHKELRR